MGLRQEDLPLLPSSGPTADMIAAAMQAPNLPATTATLPPAPDAGVILPALRTAAPLSAPTSAPGPGGHGIGAFLRRASGLPSSGVGADDIIRMLLQAAPAFMLGFAGRRGGVPAAGQVAGGISTALQNMRAEAERERERLDQSGIQNRRLDIDQQQLNETRRTRLQTESQRRDTAISGILDRARDDADKFVGTPEAFTQWKATVHKQLAQYGPEAEALADSIQFPDARFLAAVAAEDRQWWEDVFKRYEDQIMGTQAEREGVLGRKNPDTGQWEGGLTRRSAIRGGKSIVLGEALETIGLEDAHGRFTAPKKRLTSGDITRVPTGKKPGEFQFLKPEDLVGRTFQDIEKPDKPTPPRGSTQLLKDDQGHLVIVFADEKGAVHRVNLPADLQQPGGDALARLRALLGSSGDAISDDELTKLGF